MFSVLIQCVYRQPNANIFFCCAFIIVLELIIFHILSIHDMMDVVRDVICSVLRYIISYQEDGRMLNINYNAI